MADITDYVPTAASGKKEAAITNTLKYRRAISNS